MGWNAKNWGWACEQIVALDAVTAEGVKIRVDSKQNSALLWAAKGAGPGFPAVITRIYLTVRPKIPHMLSSVFVYPLSKYKEAMDWVIKITPDYDESMEIVALAVTLPGYQICIIPFFVAFKETEEECKEVLRHANETKPDGYLFADVNKQTSLFQEYRDQANANPPDHRYCSENGYVKNDADVFSISPCSRRELPDMAPSMQSNHYFALYTIWKDEGDDDKCQRWVRDIMKRVAPQCDGAYLGDADFQVRQTKFWTDEKARKLMALRQERDPAGRICGYLDHGDQAGVRGLMNADEWCNGC